MIKHYFKIAFRNISRQKVLSFINVSGLSIGIACFTLFLLFAVNELNYDRFHKNAANIYQVYLWGDDFGDHKAGGSAYLPMPLGAAMKKDFPDVVDFTRFRSSWSGNFMKLTDNDVRRVKMSYADPQFFSIFSFNLKYGAPATALKDLHSLVLTSSKAKELFGNDNVVGRTVQVKVNEDFIPFNITAVAEDIPSNSSIGFEALANFVFLETVAEKRSADNWRRSGYLTFLQLRPGSGLKGDAARFSQFRKKYYPDEEAMLKAQGVTWKGSISPIRYDLQRVKDMHTNTTIEGGTVAEINPKTIWILLSIAAAVLLIACINFTTLAIGRSAARAKEIGVRKVIGSERGQLVSQFIAEALLMTLFSALLGLLLVNLLLPWFNELSGRHLTLSLTQFPELVWMFGGLVLLVGFLSGMYPALVLSGFKPVEVLKSKVRVGGSNFFTRSLVTVQFALSVALIICTVIIMQQKQYMNGKDPGFNKENLLVVDAEETKTKQIYPLFKQALLKRSDIAGIANAELGLGEGMGWSQSGFEYEGKHRQVFEYFVDNDYIQVMGMQLIAGRNFNPAISSDTVNAVIINETMMKEFGWNVQDVIGKRLTGYHEEKTPDEKTPMVIGLVKDFNFLSLKEKIQPQMFHQFADYAPFKFFVRFKPGDPTPAIAAIQKTWSSLVPSIPLKYSFLDEDLERFYKEEQKMNNVIGLAGGISIFLASLGLFGLAALAAVNRTKEIGIRKILGASLPGIVTLLSKDFLKLILIALLIATPAAWYFMHKWLQDFAYRIDISWWVFAAAGLTALLVAFVTIGFQAVKTGIANPVKSLRNE
ncbi:MAG: ABC transporter permease [Ferruginibacter sp.]